MSAAPSRVTVDGLVPGNCYNAVNRGKEEYLGKFIRTDVDLVQANNAGGYVNVRTEQKTCVFELGTRIFRGFRSDGGIFFTQVECRTPAAAPASSGSGGAMGGAGGGGASSASSSTSNAAPVTKSFTVKLIENLNASTMEDGTTFVAAMRSGSPPYIQVKVVGPEIVANRGNVPFYKINVSDFTMTKLHEVYPDTTPARLAFLNTVVSEFRSRANNALRRSARKQRKSRRANRRKGTRQRSSKK